MADGEALDSLFLCLYPAWTSPGQLVKDSISALNYRFYLWHFFAKRDKGFFIKNILNNAEFSINIKQRR